jgi:hypothetical protein
MPTKKVETGLPQEKQLRTISAQERENANFGWRFLSPILT